MEDRWLNSVFGYNHGCVALWYLGLKVPPGCESVISAGVWWKFTSAPGKEAKHVMGHLLKGFTVLSLCSFTLSMALLYSQSLLLTACWGTIGGEFPHEAAGNLFENDVFTHKPAKGYCRYNNTMFCGIHCIVWLKIFTHIFSHLGCFHPVKTLVSQQNNFKVNDSLSLTWNTF